jgi:hypothetical protein
MLSTMCRRELRSFGYERIRYCKIMASFCIPETRDALRSCWVRRNNYLRTSPSRNRRRMAAKRRAVGATQCNPLHRNMATAVAFQPLRNIAFRHPQPAGIEITDIEDGKRATVVVLRGIVDNRGTAEPVQDAEAYSVLLQYWLQYAAHGALLGPDYNTLQLLPPEVASIRAGHDSHVLGWIVPCGHLFEIAALVNDPIPWIPSSRASFSNL